MIKKIIYFLSTILILENSGFAAEVAVPVDLPSANQNYMSLMLGSEGINTTRGTDAQLRSMIDGTITAGITDRLYGFGDRLLDFQARVRTLTGNKKLHCQLAYAFYALGRHEPDNLVALKATVTNLCGELGANFDAEFAKLCALAYSKGDIFAYKNSLEDVIKRASVRLNYDAPAVAVGEGTGGTPVKPTLPRPTGMPTPPKPGQHPVGPTVVRPTGAPTPPKPGQHPVGVLHPPMLPGVQRPRVPKPPSAGGDGIAHGQGEAVVVAPPPPVIVEVAEAAPKVERAWTEAELSALEAAEPDKKASIDTYRITIANPMMNFKSARVRSSLPAKYQGE